MARAANYIASLWRKVKRRSAQAGRYPGAGSTTIDKAQELVEESDPVGYGHLVEAVNRSGNASAAYRRLTVERQARAA